MTLFKKKRKICTIFSSRAIEIAHKNTAKFDQNQTWNWFFTAQQNKDLTFNIFIVRIKRIMLTLIVFYFISFRSIGTERSFLLTHLPNFSKMHSSSFPLKKIQKEQIENSLLHNCWFFFVCSTVLSVWAKKNTPNSILCNDMTKLFLFSFGEKKTFLIKHNWNGNAILLGGQMEVKCCFSDRVCVRLCILCVPCLSIIILKSFINNRGIFGIYQLYFMSINETNYWTFTDIKWIEWRSM